MNRFISDIRRNKISNLRYTEDLLQVSIFQRIAVVEYVRILRSKRVAVLDELLGFVNITVYRMQISSYHNRCLKSKQKLNKKSIFLRQKHVSDRSGGTIWFKTLRDAAKMKVNEVYLELDLHF